TGPFAAPDVRAVQGEPPPLPPRFAFVRTPVWDKADGDTKAAFEELTAALGSALEPVDLPPSWAEAWEVHRTIMAAEMAHNLAPLVARGEPSEALGKLLAHGRSVSGRLSRRVGQGSALSRGAQRYFRRLRRDRDAGSSRCCAEGPRFHRRSRVLYVMDLERLAGRVVAAVRRRGRSAARRTTRRPARPRRPPPAHRHRADPA